SIASGLAYAVLVIAVYLAYAVIVRECVASRIDDTRYRLTLLVAVSTAISLALSRAFLSNDVLSYIPHGQLAAGGENPNTVPVYTTWARPLADDLVALGWRPVHGPSPYGPI